MSARSNATFAKQQSRATGLAITYLLFVPYHFQKFDEKKKKSQVSLLTQCDNIVASMSSSIPYRQLKLSKWKPTGGLTPFYDVSGNLMVSLFTPCWFHPGQHRLSMQLLDWTILNASVSIARWIYQLFSCCIVWQIHINNTNRLLCFRHVRILLQNSVYLYFVYQTLEILKILLI